MCGLGFLHLSVKFNGQFRVIDKRTEIERAVSVNEDALFQGGNEPVLHRVNGIKESWDVQQQHRQDSV